MYRIIRLSSFVSLALLACIFLATALAYKDKKEWEAAVPRTWEDEMVKTTSLPLAKLGAPPVYISSDYYYRIPVRTFYKSYPIYSPSKEPPGYFEWLNQQEPQIIEFDRSKLRTEADWIKAGEMIFEAENFYNTVISLSDVRDPAWFEKAKAPIARDGTMPFARYVIRKKGKVEVGNLSCMQCHSRVLSDGTVVKGAQGNFPFDVADALAMEKGYRVALSGSFADEFSGWFRKNDRAFYAAPWLMPDPNARTEKMSIQEIITAHSVIPPGVVARIGASPFYPAKTPDLIGIRDMRYLDATGLIRHRNIGDLMRYVAFNFKGDEMARYGDFVPIEALGFKDTSPDIHKRFSDDQLFALALYIYSLRPPPSPNKFDALASRGQKVFNRERCDSCHTPPFYTNNKLARVIGFMPPKSHFEEYGVMSISIDTDPSLALETRRGTGYYKVPSLRGLWYRGPFEHNGSVATLEDWFNPRRTSDSYVPTAFVGFKNKSRAVKGHLYGLNLSKEDFQALIAFLKTL